MKKSLGKFCILWSWLFALAACGSPASTPTPVFQTQTVAATTTSTELPTIVPSATPTPMPTATLTPTTPATLQPDEARKLLLELFGNNGGCRLPCWWGFTPGTTSWSTAQNLLAQFDWDIYVSSPDQSSFFADVVIPVPEEIHPVYLGHNYTIQDGVVAVIEVQLGNTPNYELPILMSEYGVPDEIWLRTYSQAREGDLQFDVLLFYPKQGILARFAGQAEKISDQVRGCPQQRSATNLVLWSPERQLSFLEATNQTVDFRNEDWWPYRPLQEVTSMDVATFYETFGNADNTACLETPAELWPQP